MVRRARASTYNPFTSNGHGFSRRVTETLVDPPDAPVPKGAFVAWKKDPSATEIESIENWRGMFGEAPYEVVSTRRLLWSDGKQEDRIIIRPSLTPSEYAIPPVFSIAWFGVVVKEV